MSVDLKQLKPELLWKHFDALRQIPRESKNEAAARDYVISVARANGLEYEVDDVGNVVIRVPATPGHENAKTVVLQGHLDMVCEKNSDVQFDFAKDAIQVRREGEWLYAQGTTLGADNGIGVSAALALAEDKSVVHGPLELLFTIDEETGLTGASQLKPSFLKGEIFLNLDSEEEGVFIIGCSGGADTVFSLSGETVKPDPGKALRIHVGGLKGGHSGLDIDKNRGNAIKFLVRLLWPLSRSFSIQLAKIGGGNKRNAIPREAFAEIVVGEDQVPRVKTFLQETFDLIHFEYNSVETDAKLTVSDLPERPEAVFTETFQQMLLNFLYALPHGVQKMSADIPDLVETSVNLALIKQDSNTFHIETSSRSSINSALKAMTEQLRAFGELVAAEVKQPEGYPGWTPNLDSKILQVVKETHKKVTGKDAEIKAIHAGLECGIIGEKYPGMDMVSLGPTIENPHSPDERVSIPSVERFYSLLKATLEELA